MSGKEKFNINVGNQPNGGIAITVVGERGRKEMPPGTKGGENPSAWAGVKFPWSCASSHPFSASFVLIFLAKGGHFMQEKTIAGKPGSSKKSLDEKTTYRFGNRSFVVEPVFRQDGPDTLGSILLRLMKSESEAK